MVGPIRAGTTFHLKKINILTASSGSNLIDRVTSIVWYLYFAPLGILGIAHDTTPCNVA